MYLTLEEYLDFGGEKVTDSSQFERLEYKAWKLVDTRTQGRIREPLENIKRLMVELIDLEFEKTNQGVKQVSNDGVAVTYKDDVLLETKEEELIQDYAGKYAWRGVSDLRQTS